MTAGVETDPAAFVGDEACTQGVALPGRYWRLTQVCLVDDSDHHNELVQEREFLLHLVEPLSLQGNCFCFESLLEGAGFVLVRTAPLPYARPQLSDWDVRIQPDLRRRVFHYVCEGDPSQWSRISFTGGRRGASAALQAWQRDRRPAHAIHRLPRFITNTWGDRGRDSRINHDFIIAELEAAAAIGADCLQIDDGWQTGRSCNSASTNGRLGYGFRYAQQDFWTVDRARFPRGLAPICDRARELGIEVGLWFAPDRAHAHACWEQDAAALLALHREHGISMFKIDFVDTSSQEALTNFKRMTQRVHQESQGAIHLEFDCTAGHRPGYFGYDDAAPIFIENRYTDWATYLPHATLRNLWSLARWIDPLRMRMEFLNPRRNLANYESSPLCPNAYQADTLFASVMAACPLGWFEASALDADDARAIADIATVWRAHRATMAACFVDTIGVRPDGIGYSGFRWWHPGHQHGYLLILRGSGDADRARIEWEGEPVENFQMLAGAAELTYDDGQLRITGLAARGYCFARYRE